MHWHLSNNRQTHPVLPKKIRIQGELFRGEESWFDTYNTIFVCAIVEAIKEVSQDLVFTPLAIHVFRVILHHVDTTQIFDSDHSIMISGENNLDCSTFHEEEDFQRSYRSSLAKARATRSRRKLVIGG